MDHFVRHASLMDTVIGWFKESSCIEKCRISIYSEVSTFADFVHSTLTIERFTTMISKEVDLNHTHRVYRSFNAYRVTELMQMWMSHWCYGDNAMTTKDRLLTSLWNTFQHTCYLPTLPTSILESACRLISSHRLLLYSSTTVLSTLLSVVIVYYCITDIDPS